jgi:hypothetical protein
MKARFQFCVIFYPLPLKDTIHKRVVALSSRDSERVADIFRMYPRNGLAGLRNITVRYLEKTEFECEIDGVEGVVDCHRFLDFHPTIFILGEKMMMRGRARSDTIEIIGGPPVEYDIDA